MKLQKERVIWAICGTRKFWFQTTPPFPPWMLEASVRKSILQMHTPACTSQCWSQQTPHGLRVCIWMHLVNGMGNLLSPGQPTPGVVKQDKSSRGSVDTTKTRSDPQRVRMSSGERPIGAANGKQSDTEALCHPPPLPLFKYIVFLWGAASPPLSLTNAVQSPPTVPDPAQPDPCPPSTATPQQPPHHQPNDNPPTPLHHRPCGAAGIRIHAIAAPAKGVAGRRRVNKPAGSGRVKGMILRAQVVWIPTGPGLPPTHPPQ